MNRKPWLVALMLFAIGLVIGAACSVPSPRLIRAASAAEGYGVDHDGDVGTIPITTSTGTTPRLLVAAPSDPDSRVFLQGQLFCRDASTTAPHDLTLWSRSSAGVFTQIGGVIPLGVSTSTSPGGFCEDERGGARRTLPGEALYYSIDNNAGTATDCNVSGSYVVRR